MMVIIWVKLTNYATFVQNRFQTVSTATACQNAKNVIKTITLIFSSASHALINSLDVQAVLNKVVQLA